MGCSTSGGKSRVLFQTKCRSWKTILDSSGHLLHIINDILDMSRIEQGKVEVHTAPLDIHALLRGCITNIEALAREKGITLIAVAQDFGRSKEAKIMRALMWSLSEYYLDNLSSETKKGHKETALKGLHNGGYAPFGYDVVNQTYIINELEAGYIKRITESRRIYLPN